jgi:hypothetical protein
MVTSPQVSWLFFKAVRAGLAVKHPYLSHTGRASNAEKQPTGRGPEGCVENGPARGNVWAYRCVDVSAFAKHHELRRDLLIIIAVSKSSLTSPDADPPDPPTRFPSRADP